MKISEVLAISGKPGLFKVLATTQKNLVVESMVDGKRTSVPGSIRVSSLSDITMYTLNDDVPLKDIFEAMFKKTDGKITVLHNDSPQKVKDFVDGIIKDLDHDRVYASDLRKLVLWYNMLISQKALPFEKEDKKEGDEENEKSDDSTSVAKKAGATGKAGSADKKKKPKGGGKGAVKKTVPKRPTAKTVGTKAAKKG